MLIYLARSRCESILMSRPSSSSRPLSLGRNPVSVFSNVDFPIPFEPIKQVSSPLLISTFILETTGGKPL